MSHFNYIITCHNSEALIECVLDGVANSQRETYGDSRVYVVLDGCTDHTEPLVDQYAPIQKVHTPDVHELLSINAGLRAAPQEGDGYNIILQDDVILEDPDLESKIETLYKTIPHLGYVSLRMAFNLGSAELTPAGYFAQVDEIESAYGAGVCGNVLLPGRFAPRTCPIKSPVVLPCKLVRELGMFNEDLAPYAYDDLEYAIRATMAGYVNGVFSVPFRSDVRWGGSRKPGHPDIQPVARRNAKYIAERYVRELLEMVYVACETPHYTVEGVGIPGIEAGPVEDEAAMQRWAESQAVLKALNP